MAMTYFDMLRKRGIDPFLSAENHEALLNFDPKAQYAMPKHSDPAFQSTPQYKIEVGKTTTLIGDMCWYGATEDELVRAIKHGMVVIEAEKHHLDWRRSGKDHGIDELRKKYRRFYRKPRFSEREKLIITVYTGYPLIDDSAKIIMFIEEELGHSTITSETPDVMEIHKALKDEFCEICRRHHIFDYI